MFAIVKEYRDRARSKVCCLVWKVVSFDINLGKIDVYKLNVGISLEKLRLLQTKINDKREYILRIDDTLGTIIITG